MNELNPPCNTGNNCEGERMNTPKSFESEYRFCTILWEHEPIESTQLVKLCAQKLGWSKAVPIPLSGA